METLANVASILLLVFGFGFVVFWHELGHFLAAKAVGIKVEQFAVGFGQAMLCWRKGLGLTVGTSAGRYQKAVYTEWERRQAETGRLAGEADRSPTSQESRDISAALGLGETEYRLNWIPLGGYVKMLGQDDLDPTVKETDPRAYNNKSVSARMLVVSAGVVMNIILAAILFMGLFMWGFKVSPPLVGGVQPGSPAQKAGVQVGDRIVSIDGNATHDFNKVSLNVVLLQAGQPVPVKVIRGGQELTLTATPERPTEQAKDFLALGVEPARALRGPKVGTELEDGIADRVLPDRLAIMPGDVITAIAGEPVPPEELGRDDQTPSAYGRLDAALQASDGKPVALTVRDAAGKVRETAVLPSWATPFRAQVLTVAGIIPRPKVTFIDARSSALGKIRPGDTLVSVQSAETRDVIPATSIEAVRKAITDAGKTGKAIDVVVERGSERITVAGVTPNIKLDDGGRGLGIGMEYAADGMTVASVKEGSPAERAGLRGGERIVAVRSADGTEQPVVNLFELRTRLLAALPPDSAGGVSVITELDGKRATRVLPLSASDRAELASLRATHRLALAERIEPRRTGSPVTALGWGITETRDLILQGYITIKRMAQGSVSPSNLTGPVGIFHAGGRIATTKSTDWIVWFLAMISANLAVVNFLPIPIVDGGLFCFLILEKLMGRPLSPRAQSIAQIVGLGLILSVFLFVTYNDISRLLL